MKKLLCIDGNSIVNRQFYGIRFLSASDGFPTNAIFGTVNVIAKQLETLKPDHVAVAFDLKAPTFRHKMYAEYKAGRKPMPDELRVQIPAVKEICSALGIAVLELEGYEADDILGTLAHMTDLACEAGEDMEAYVLTGDRDSLQLIDDNVKVLLATNTDTVTYDRAAFFEKYGVESSTFVDVKALMGDSSDNIPGVPGIGEKTAFKLISEKGSIEKIYEDIEQMQLSPSVRRKLTEGKESAFMSKRLATIFCDVPLGISLSDIEYHGIDRQRARSLFVRYGLSGSIKRFGLDREEEMPADISGTEESGTRDEPVAESTRPKTRCVRPEELAGEWYAISISNGDIYASDGENAFLLECDSTGLEKFLGAHKIICYDCKNVYKALEAQGIKYRDCAFDVMLGAYVEDSMQSGYTLEGLCMKYLGVSPDESCPAAYYVASMWQTIAQGLDATSQREIFERIEMPLSAVLCDMELLGCRIDAQGIYDYGVYLDERSAELEARIFTYAGEEFNINSPKQLGEVLFERLMLPTGKKTKTGYSTNAEVLEKLKRHHPIIEDILDYRQVTKLKGTYVDGLLKAIDSQGRVHTTFKQTGTATGRLSSADPNLQNIPIKTELGRRFRRYFVPTDADHLLIDADYSQIELRVMAHIANDKNMIDAFRSGYDIHSATACRMFGADPENVSVELRKRAKAVNFGILYGMGEFSLSEDLGVSRITAKEYIKSYLDSYPAVEEYLDRVVKEAKTNGYAVTMLGRRRSIPELSAQNKNVQAFGQRVAMNSPIQGTSADIIKLAMINVSKRLSESGTGARLLLQVHDELLVECPREHAQTVLEILRDEMENAVSLSVPLSVEAKAGENWYECH